MTVVQEKLNESNQIKTGREENKQKEKAAAEAEEQLLHATPVTKANFLS